VWVESIIAEAAPARRPASKHDACVNIIYEDFSEGVFAFEAFQVQFGDTASAARRLMRHPLGGLAEKKETVVEHWGKWRTFNMHSYSLRRLTILLFIRIAIVVSFQLLFVLALSWDKAMPWWPFSMIATEAVCLVMLIMLLKKENRPFASIQLTPFDTLLPLGRVTDFLNRKSPKNRLMNSLDILIFIILLLLLGVPAIVLNGFMSQNISVLRDTSTIGILPDWALYLMMALLPLAQAFVEFPWFYGYIYPRLETHFETDSGDRRIIASIKALSITLAFFVLQTVLIPLIMNPYYMFWRAIAFVPLLLSIGIVIRLAPRFMPGVNIVHALLAINVVLQYWKVK
jgi:hypothetical protein